MAEKVIMPGEAPLRMAVGQIVHAIEATPEFRNRQAAMAREARTFATKTSGTNFVPVSDEVNAAFREIDDSQKPDKAYIGLYFQQGGEESLVAQIAPDGTATWQIVHDFSDEQALSYLETIVKRLAESDQGK